MNPVVKTAILQVLGPNYVFKTNMEPKENNPTAPSTGIDPLTRREETENMDLPSNPNSARNFKDKHQGPALLATNQFQIIERVLGNNIIKSNECFQDHTDTIAK